MKSKIFLVFILCLGFLPVGTLYADPFDDYGEEEEDIKYVFRSDYDQVSPKNKETAKAGQSKNDQNKVVKNESVQNNQQAQNQKNSVYTKNLSKPTNSNSKNSIYKDSLDKDRRFYISDNNKNYKNYRVVNNKTTKSNSKNGAENGERYIRPATEDGYDPETGDPRITTITTTTTTTKTIRPLKVENIGSAEDREKERLRKLELKKIYSHTAEGFKQLQIDALGTTLVIDREEIERLHANTIADLISNRTGIEVARKGTYHNDTYVMIQGSTPKQVLVLVNNVPVSSALDSQSFLEDIPIEIVERVEITTNPQSVIYGSGANGGVINITTAKTDKFGDIQFSFGDYLTGKLNGRARGAFNQDETVITVNGSVNISQGMKVNQFDTTANKEGSQNMHFDIVFNQKITDTARLNIAFNYTNVRKNIAEVPLNIYKNLGIEQLYSTAMPASMVANGRTNTYGITQDRSQYGLNFDIGGDINNGWGMRFLASANLNTNIYSLLATDHSTLKAYGKWDNYFHNDYSKVSFGLDFNRNQILPTSSNAGPVPSNKPIFKYNNYATNTLGLYLQTRFDIFKSVSLFLGGRYDVDPSKFKKLGGYSGDFGLVWHINENYSLGLSLALGHRLPTLLEMYNLDNGNANLKPESNLSTELFWRYANLDGWYVGLILFYRNDLSRIYLDTLNNVYADNGKAENVGGEIYFGKKFDNVRFQVNLTGQYPLGKKPKDWSAMLYSRFDFDYVGENWSLGTGVNFALNRVDGTQKLPIYALLNVKASWNFIAHWQLFAKMDFTITKKHQTIYGYDTPSHYYEVGIKASF